MKRCIAVGDIHGEYELLRELVEKQIGFEPSTDQLVFLGDYIDRGRRTREVVDYLCRLAAEHPERIVLLMGNHEELALDAFRGGGLHDLRLWFLNGGEATVRSYGGFEKARDVLLPFIEGLRLYWENESHVFVHAGVAAALALPEMSRETLLWSRAMVPHSSGKTVVVGHSPHDRVTFHNGVVAVDTGAVFSGRLSGYDVLGARVYTAHRSPGVGSSQEGGS